MSSYLTRSLAARFAMKQGWKSFTTYYDNKVGAWYVREVALDNPAELWAERDFVHHVEFALVDSKLVPCLVVNVRRDEITEDVPEAWVIEPLTRDLWHDVTEATRGAGTRAKSEIESPVKVVWRLADEMKGADRKAVIEACVAAGVNKSTAATQYYKWAKAQA